jgi:hypothetical protein
MIVVREYAHFQDAPAAAGLEAVACPRWATSLASARSGFSGVNALVTSFISARISAERLAPASEDMACVTGRVGPQVKQER